MASLNYEELGYFYLGREQGATSTGSPALPLLYDANDLVTHAVCVGMTGSGKTGLGITLLEEAAIDHIPCLVIDPKGDMTNLLLNFPALRAEDFKPWLPAEEAVARNMSLDGLAEERARQWRDGLAAWDQGPERIGRLREACDFAIYTPGSDSGLPLSILASFEAPPPGLRDDSDALRDRIQTTVTSLLSLLGIDADPIRSREHILLTSLLDARWRAGQDVSLAALIQLVQEPPLEKIGVMPLESFFPKKERWELAMVLNNLLAAPGFSVWLKGEPLDMKRMLYAPSGQPRVSIFCIAHLSDSERMFFMSLFLNQLIGWMRAQSGTTRLRAILYIDEIFGYLPPVANPPSKQPLLTLLKQARAYGLGLVLATQNPVDLDYKALSNAGTWFLGRLQTEQDKERVLDGLQGASSQAGTLFDRKSMSDILSGVGKRVFLMHNVHNEQPVLLQTRWALSYLAGPLTRSQIRTLMEGRKDVSDPMEETATDTSPSQPQADAAPAGPETSAAPRPVLSHRIKETFLPVRDAITTGPIRYEPWLAGHARIHFADSRKGLAADNECVLLLPASASAAFLDWSQAVRSAETGELREDDGPHANAHFAELPEPMLEPKNYTQWRKDLIDHLYRYERFNIFLCKRTGEYSKPGESERDFGIRVREALRDHREAAIEELRQKFATRIARLESSIRTAEDRLSREQHQADDARFRRNVSLGEAVFTSLFGRRRSLGKASTAARGYSRAEKEMADVRRAEESLEERERQLRELEDDLRARVDELKLEYSEYGLEFESYPLKPRKSDVNVRDIFIAWRPVADGDTFGSRYLDSAARVESR